ncbi:Arginine/serine-rich zinc knuckle-containing protein 33 putative isoform 1 [Tripterygium wilfordii]|uniref:Arginine/serine-rich zinc knuckle-containing protein 33 putative isoform 1 n=1 Tax=Tripterygium wilfordii TaxID=458696 RepID=A0A7J7DW84_TRIWF|nr:Arginine/serine-rich zinc knuckle-containing protein 33 putative isoform 1 [Tripterygium wilfordii]
MSLYIGKLSSLTRRDDLERVFGRFGRCNIRIKDGYGFVVYVFPPDAEKASRALQGRNICGQPLTLTWSNKQPQAFKRFARDDRSYEPLRKRYSAIGGDYVNRNLDSDGNRDYKMDTKQSDRVGGRLSSTDVLNEERSNYLDQMKDYMGGEDHDGGDLQKEGHGLGEHLLDEGGTVERNLVENGRWGEQVHDLPNRSGPEHRKEYDQYEACQGYYKKDEDEGHDLSNGSGAENRKEYDQYEACQGYYKKDEDEGHDLSNGSGAENRKEYDQYEACQGYYKKDEDEGLHKARSNDFLLQQSNQGKKGRENTGEVTLNHSSDSKFKRTCYSCGRLGHKSCCCPFVYTSRRNLAKHYLGFINDSDRDNRGQCEHRRIRSPTRRKLQTSRDTLRRRQLRDDRKASGSRKRQKLTRSGSSPLAKETDKAPKADYGKKKYGTHKTKNTKGLFLLLFIRITLLSNQQSASRSSKPTSRSVSSRIQSLTSNSKSSSTSLLARSKSFNSRSRSSSPTSLSLSVSLHQPLPAYPNEGKSNLKGSVDKGATLESTKEFINQEQLVDVGVSLESAEQENMMAAVVNEHGVSSSKLGSEFAEDQTVQRDIDGDKKNVKAPDERMNRIPHY